MYTQSVIVAIYFLFNFVTVISQDIHNMVWGPAECEDATIRPFTLEWPEAAICDLRYRLKNTRVSDPLPGVNFTYGFDTDYLNRWMDYWAYRYDFAKQAERLNQLPQYKTCIQGLDIHFLWVKPEVNVNKCKVLPVLLLHGFPDSVVKFYKTIPLLTSCVHGIALEVIAPSLPGFAYSDGANKPGFGTAQIATVMVKLMERLDFDRFYVQSGDYAQTGSAIATLYPEKTLGFHANYAVSFSPLSWAMWIGGALSPTLVIDHPMEADRMFPVYDIAKNLLMETGFLHMLATKPDTLSIALADSPAGLCSLLLNVGLWGTKRHYTKLPDGGLSDFYMEDELDNCGYYWFPGPDAITKPARMFAETLKEIVDKEGHHSIPTEVPTWTTHAKNDIFCQSSTLLKIKYPNLITAEVLEDGGHFLAYEKPEYFAESLRSAIATFNKIHEHATKFEL